MDLAMTPQLLMLIGMSTPYVEELHERWPLAAVQNGDHLAALPSPCAAGIRAVVTNGSTGLSAAQMDLLPALQLVCSYGAGYENIDLAAAAARRIAVTHAPGVNNATVADHAMALLLGSARGLPMLDRAVKAGHWLAHRTARPAVHGKRLGIVGMGNIGALIARRAAGFDMQVAYYTRQARPELPYRHVDGVRQLARDSDYLVLACPGGAATRHLVDAAVLEALGPRGFLVNISRGSVVDTAALIRALERRAIAGAALDVIEGEPALPAGAAQLDSLILTPHISGRSPEAQQAQHAVLMANLTAHFSGGQLMHTLTA